MYKVLILYPALFNVKSKFERKLNSILTRLFPVNLIYQKDEHGFIQEYANLKGYKLTKISSLDLSEFTHLIIFDDGEEFAEILEKAKAYNLPYRFIKVKLTRVINIDKEDPYQYGAQYEYIGRNPRRSPNTPNWCNPYSMYDFQIGEDIEELSRESVIQKFAYGFEHDNLPTNLKKSDTYQLAGKRLGCHCKPEKCHGDIIADFLNSWDDGL